MPVRKPNFFESLHEDTANVIEKSLPWVIIGFVVFLLLMAVVIYFVFRGVKNKGTGAGPIDSHDDWNPGR